MEQILHGLTEQPSQKMDRHVVEDLQVFLNKYIYLMHILNFCYKNWLYVFTFKIVFL